MSMAPTRWIKRLVEHLPKEDADEVPPGTRGIYVLFAHRRGDRYDVVYVGLSKSGIRSRLRSHRRSRKKAQEWTHFSVFEVHDNISEAEIGELEGLFRLIYRRDSSANRFNVQKKHRPLSRVRRDLVDWNKEPPNVQPKRHH
jgi:hypothetical protein